MLTIVFGSSVFGRETQAQPTNVDVFGNLAVQCLGGVPDTSRALMLNAPEGMPYVRSALTKHWLSEGIGVYLTDSARAEEVPAHLTVLRYGVEDAGIEYSRTSRRTFRRSVRLALRYDLASPSGRLISDDRCRRAYTDDLAVSLLDTIQPDPYPEARAQLTGRSGPGRFLEPIVLGTAMATIVYLFFTVRS
jgi:hypothetical protein